MNERTKCVPLLTPLRKLVHLPPTYSVAVMAKNSLQGLENKNFQQRSSDFGSNGIKTESQAEER